MFGLFKSRCGECSTDIDGAAVKKFGKKFCSDEHAAAFQKEVESKKGRGTKRKSGCCCG